MTREDILAMPTGRELDVLVSEKVMGYKFPTIEEMKEEAEEQWKVQPDCVQFLMGFNAWLEDGEFKWQYRTKLYSTLISAAWEVVEKIQEKKLVRLHANEGECICKIGGDLLEYKCNSNSMPEAICKAALITVLEGQTYET